MALNILDDLTVAIGQRHPSNLAKDQALHSILVVSYSALDDGKSSTLHLSVILKALFPGLSQPTTHHCYPTPHPSHPPMFILSKHPSALLATVVLQQPKLYFIVSFWISIYSFIRALDHLNG